MLLHGARKTRAAIPCFAGLRDRFDRIDETAEYNQLKVLKAFNDCRVSEACFQGSSGYGYNDLGRDTLEKV